MDRRKPGTRPKGKRHAITVRVPDDQWNIYVQTASREGYDSLSDYVCALLAKEHNLRVPEYATPASTRQKQDLLWAG